MCSGICPEQINLPRILLPSCLCPDPLNTSLMMRMMGMMMIKKRFYRDQRLQTRLPCLLKFPQLTIIFPTSNLGHVKVKGACIPCPPRCISRENTKLALGLENNRFSLAYLASSEKGQAQNSPHALFHLGKSNTKIHYIALSHLPGFLKCYLSKTRYSYSFLSELSENFMNHK